MCRNLPYMTYGSILHFNNGQKCLVIKDPKHFIQDHYCTRYVEQPLVVDLETFEVVLRPSTLWNLNSKDSQGVSNLTIWGGVEKVTKFKDYIK